MWADLGSFERGTAVVCSDSRIKIRKLKEFTPQVVAHLDPENPSPRQLATFAVSYSDSSQLMRGSSRRLTLLRSNSPVLITFSDGAHNTCRKPGGHEFVDESSVVRHRRHGLDEAVQRQDC